MIDILGAVIIVCLGVGAIIGAGLMGIAFIIFGADILEYTDEE